ncbi:3'-to-5' exoribonuclease RNase R [Anaerovibrio sp. JC8]|uniref:ribonuclease R n=1 Tax=Anaerovibrio sp. JC8 TaxID=1240085 RepID=UPI000A0C4299|nr:ribonuclease R [Anaerovibrio sp. JC8]ORU00994.1 3'-to-5' exoribonuclease RNase R [Anaerovibrio sp. JC8]
MKRKLQHKKINKKIKQVKNKIIHKEPAAEDLVTGTLALSSRGFGFVTPEGMQKNEDDIFILKSGLNTAMNGDKVQVRLFPQYAVTPGRSKEGEVYKVIERANSKIVGIFSASRNFGFVSPDDTRIREDIYIPAGQFLGAKTGDKVVVEVTQWPEEGRKAEGHIVEVLGKSGAPGVDILSIMRQYDLAEEFPQVVQQAANAVEQSIKAEEHIGKDGREDRRHLKIVTIDGEDAKDLDDGVYVEKHDDGSFFLGVYIADVSWYVRENQPLDIEAQARGTSVYLVDRVVPMLPKELSNGICSLNAGVDRLSMACEMEISPEGMVTKYKILPVVVHVYRRLTYTLVNKILVDRDVDFCRDNEDILPLLYNLEEVRNAMYKHRHSRGSINFEVPEIKVKLDENGRAVGLKKRVSNLGESIVEQCMLAANETVAEHMCRRKQPFMYRIHETPEPSKIEALNRLMGTFGLHIKTSPEGNVRPKELQIALEKIAGRPEEKILSTVSLRSMQQARYAAENEGHFGLAAEYYTHFTSPIRRYPDLIVHRLLRESFPTGSIPKARREQLITNLPEMADHASKRERIAVSAERDTTDLKKVEYMEQFVGDTFEGVISSVTGFGFFVELDNGVEGLVHMTTLKDDYYDYVESRYALVGNHHHRSYQLGDTVEVILVRASVEEKSLDFVVKDNCDSRALLMENSSDRKPKEKSSGKKSKEKISKATKAGKKSTKAEKKTGKSDKKSAKKFDRKKPSKDKKKKVEKVASERPKKKTKASKRNKHDHKSVKKRKNKDNIIVEI